MNQIIVLGSNRSRCLLFVTDDLHDLFLSPCTYMVALLFVTELHCVDSLSAPRSLQLNSNYMFNINLKS